MNNISRHHELPFWLFFNKKWTEFWSFSGHTFFTCSKFCFLRIILSSILHRIHKEAESKEWTVVMFSNASNPSGVSLTLNYPMYEPVFQDGVYRCEAVIRTRGNQSWFGTVNTSSDNIPLKSKQFQLESPLLLSSAKSSRPFIFYHRRFHNYKIYCY